MRLPRFPRPPGRVMRTDDVVAPGIRRRRVGYLVAAAILLFTVSLVGIVGTLNARTQLSQDEVVQIRDYLTEARQRRDSEKEQTQAQLDEQARALCDVLVTFEDGDDASAVRRIKAAEAKLACGRFSSGIAPTSSPG